MIFPLTDAPHIDVLDFLTTQSQQTHFSQPDYRFLNPNAQLSWNFTATPELQHSTHTTSRVNRPVRPRTHVCNIAPCNGATFGRRHELCRHHASAHDVHNARFWCPIDGCDRSKMDGGRAFPRKDKMVDHLMRVHGDRVGSAA